MSGAPRGMRRLLLCLMAVLPRGSDRGRLSASAAIVSLGDKSDRHGHIPRYLSMFNPDFDAVGQHSFANLGMSESLQALVEAHEQYGMKGFLSVQNVGVWKAVTTGHHNQNETGLEPCWRANLTSVLTTATPHLQSGAVAGIFLGDERCCSGIPFSNVSSVAGAVRAFLDRVAPHALVYLNECSTPFDDCQKYNPSLSCWGDSVPTSIDLISLDIYHHAGSSTDNPATEADTAEQFVNAHVKPKLNPHQRLFVVPGTFADWNQTRSGSVLQQQDGIVAKLNAYWKWVQRDPLISGINCWHWSTIPNLYKRSPGIIPFYYGVDHMPKVLSRLVEIGAIIRTGGNTTHGNKL